jgi:hypothetical protein
MRFRRGEIVPPRTDSKFAFRGGDHLRRSRGYPERFLALTPTRKLERFAAVRQIITRDSPLQACSNKDGSPRYH